MKVARITNMLHGFKGANQHTTHLGKNLGQPLILDYIVGDYFVNPRMKNMRRIKKQSMLKPTSEKN